MEPLEKGAQNTQQVINVGPPIDAFITMLATLTKRQLLHDEPHLTTDCLST